MAVLVACDGFSIPEMLDQAIDDSLARMIILVNGDFPTMVAEVVCVPDVGLVTFLIEHRCRQAELGEDATATGVESDFCLPRKVVDL